MDDVGDPAHVVEDDLVVVESGASAAEAPLGAARFFAEHGVAIERVLTEKGRVLYGPASRRLSRSAPATSGSDPIVPRPTASRSGSLRPPSATGPAGGSVDRTTSALRPSRDGSVSTTTKAPPAIGPRHRSVAGVVRPRSVSPSSVRQTDLGALSAVPQSMRNDTSRPWRMAAWWPTRSRAEGEQPGFRVAERRPENVVYANRLRPETAWLPARRIRPSNAEQPAEDLSGGCPATGHTGQKQLAAQ